ncbi:MAG: molybdenum cofactor synthesis domain protein [Pseudonocardia sp.]|nr:molybdenum cofactor synthesis domain protein [Pseudonocardia sp.]
MGAPDNSAALDASDDLAPGSPPLAGPASDGPASDGPASGSPALAGPASAGPVSDGPASGSPAPGSAALDSPAGGSPSAAPGTPAPGPESPRTARVVTASNRAAAGVYADRGGPLIVDWLREHGFDCPDPTVVPDGEPVGDALRAAVADRADVVITTGGTGISPTDATPEITRRVLDYEVPGLADAIRAAGAPKVPTAVLSRGLAGVAGRTLVVNLPGSTGGVRDGLAVLDGVLEHAVDQLRGGDHR